MRISCNAVSIGWFTDKSRWKIRIQCIAVYMLPPVVLVEFNSRRTELNSDHHKKLKFCNILPLATILSFEAYFRINSGQTGMVGRSVSTTHTACWLVQHTPVHVRTFAPHCTFYQTHSNITSPTQTAVWVTYIAGTMLNYFGSKSFSCTIAN